MSAKSRKRRARATISSDASSSRGPVRWPLYLVLATVVGGVIVVIGNWRRPSYHEAMTVAVTVPELSDAERAGGAAFELHCMTCHGKNASGSRFGPPLVHKVYEPAHHGDRSFYLAVQRGVTAHHWRYGHMPRLPAVTDTEIGVIIHYVRALQRANGID